MIDRVLSQNEVSFLTKILFTGVPMRKMLSFLFALLAVAFLCPTCHADMFNLASGFFTQAGADIDVFANGQIAIDTINGVVTEADFTLDDGFDPVVDFDSSDATVAQFLDPGIFGILTYHIDILNSDGASLDLVLPVHSLIGYTGGPICNEVDPHSLLTCREVSSQIDNPADPTLSGVAFEGSLTPFIPPVTSPPTSPSPIPEPSSILLLSTGALGALGRACRKAVAKTK
jgi:hypothetical protein